ncbi:hypothetical protein EMIT079MI2_30243 [Bacillus sp. IT-79MI2]
MFQDSRKYVSYLSIPSLHFLSISSLYDKKGMMRANLCELLVNIQKKMCCSTILMNTIQRITVLYFQSKGWNDASAYTIPCHN